MIHDGHRQRLLNRFRKEGLTNFEPHLILEMLLFYAKPRVDTNETAHLLIDRFGSLSAVLDAPESELLKVKGVGEGTATFLKLIPQVAQKYIDDGVKKQKVSSANEAGKILVPKFIGKKNETVIMLSIDGNNTLLSCEILKEGGRNAAELDISKLVASAAGIGASAVILAHNHPNGLSLPSQDDVIMTKKAAEALKTVEIRLIDHLIISDSSYVSMAESGQI